MRIPHSQTSPKPKIYAAGVLLLCTALMQVESAPFYIGRLSGNRLAPGSIVMRQLILAQILAPFLVFTGLSQQVPESNLSSYDILKLHNPDIMGEVHETSTWDASNMEKLTVAVGQTGWGALIASLPAQMQCLKHLSIVALSTKKPKKENHDQDLARTSEICKHANLLHTLVLDGLNITALPPNIKYHPGLRSLILRNVAILPLRIPQDMDEGLCNEIVFFLEVISMGAIKTNLSLCDCTMNYTNLTIPESVTIRPRAVKRLQIEGGRLALLNLVFELVNDVEVLVLANNHLTGDLQCLPPAPLANLRELHVSREPDLDTIHSSIYLACEQLITVAILDMNPDMLMPEDFFYTDLAQVKKLKLDRHIYQGIDRFYSGFLEHKLTVKVYGKTSLGELMKVMTIQKITGGLTIGDQADIVDFETGADFDNNAYSQSDRDQHDWECPNATGPNHPSFSIMVFGQLECPFPALAAARVVVLSFFPSKGSKELQTDDQNFFLDLIRAYPNLHSLIVRFIHKPFMLTYNVMIPFRAAMKKLNFCRLENIHVDALHDFLNLGDLLFTENGINIAAMMKDSAGEWSSLLPEAKKLSTIYLLNKTMFGIWHNHPKNMKTFIKADYRLATLPRPTALKNPRERRGTQEEGLPRPNPTPNNTDICSYQPICQVCENILFPRQRGPAGANNPTYAHAWYRTVETKDVTAVLACGHYVCFWCLNYRAKTLTPTMEVRADTGLPPSVGDILIRIVPAGPNMLIRVPVLRFIAIKCPVKECRAQTAYSHMEHLIDPNKTP
ncbi:hypothetical protein NEDG_01969 [Nematocida displodere]|uniref:Uncharacterized protein n=1 Tax=Nematocida displodere TaxID=1805483 RepID=A0A177EJY6_9MICR|nr:hypothetical protein NEDG_01969 [Nematocida displodere]